MLGLLLGCGLRRSEVVGLRLDQLQLRESHWVIVDLVGKGGRLRTVPVPAWCKGLVDVWLRHSGVSEGKMFRRVLKNGAQQDAGVTANVVRYAVKRYAKRAGIDNLASRTHLGLNSNVHFIGRSRVSERSLRSRNLAVYITVMNALQRNDTSAGCNFWRMTAYQAQIEGTYVDQLPFQNVLPSAQVSASHATRLIAVSKAAFHQFAAGRSNPAGARNPS